MEENIKKIQEVLKEYQFKVNTDKTEYTSISKSEEGWKGVKKVGSLIDDDKDVERRKQLATVAPYKLNNVWIKGNKLKTSTKIKLCKSLVKSILLNNCGTWALTLTEEERLNAYHRKQLKKIPQENNQTNRFIESAKKSYCHYKSYRLVGVSLVIFYEETKTFLKIKQQEPILSLMVTNCEDDRGRPKTTLPTVFNRDLALIQDPVRLHSSKDLAESKNQPKTGNVGGDKYQGYRKLPKCHRLRTEARNGNKSSKSHIFLYLLVLHI